LNYMTNRVRVNLTIVDGVASWLSLYTCYAKEVFRWHQNLWVVTIQRYGKKL
jgi:hypothetical protein